MKYAALLCALGLAGAATLACAAPGAQGHDPMARIKAADTNGDGMISRDEAKALPRLASHFDEIDANHDNQLTADELRAFHQKMHGFHELGVVEKWLTHAHKNNMRHPLFLLFLQKRIDVKYLLNNLSGT